MQKKQNRLFQCVAALAVVGCMLTGCGSAAKPSVPAEETSYEVNEEENGLTAADNSWAIEVSSDATSQLIAKTYTNAVQDLEAETIDTYAVLADQLYTYSDGSQLYERVIAISEEELVPENSLEELLARAVLPETNGICYAVLGYEYDKDHTLKHASLRNMDDTFVYTYVVENGQWVDDSIQTDNEFLDKFAPLFTKLSKDLQGFLQEQEASVAQVAEQVITLVNEALPYAPSIDDITGTCGDATWSLKKSGVLIISGNGSTGNYTYKKNPSWYEYREQITMVKVKEGVTEIGDCTFYGLSNLTSVEIASSVTSIGSGIFAKCTALTEVVLPETLNITKKSYGMFDGCSALTAVTLPSNLTAIPDDFFNGCKSLTSLTIPQGVTYIGISAFDGCSALTEVNFGGTEAEWAALIAPMHVDEETHEEFGTEDIGNDVLYKVTVNCAQ